MAYLAAPNAKGTTVPFSGTVVEGPWQNPIAAFPGGGSSIGGGGDPEPVTTAHGFVA